MPKLYGLPTESHDSLNGRAHPGGGTETIEVKSGEGLVEDLYETHLKSLYVAYREPTAVRLASLASQLEQEGFAKIAEEVDGVLAGVFDAGLVKEADIVGTLGAAMGLLLNPGVTIGYGFYSFFNDELQDLETDCEELVMNIGGAQLFGDIGVGPMIGGWYDDDALKDGKTEINPVAQRMLDNAKKLQSTLVKVRSLISQMAGKDRSEETVKDLVKAAQDMDALISSLDSDLNHIKSHYAPNAKLDFKRTTSLLKDIQTHKLHLANAVQEALAKNGVQQSITPAQTAQPQAKMVNPPAQGQPGQLGEKAQEQLRRAQEAMEDFAGLQSVANEKESVPGAGQKIQALMTPEFLGAIKNLRDNIIPSLQKGTRKPDKYPGHDATASIERAENQIKLVYNGLAAIQ